MIYYMEGDLLKSQAEALVNTVNCEGYMGKGIAYQFKLQFPENNIAYVKACSANLLAPGKMFSFKEKGKIIINFPTKNKWREKSKIEYILNGLDDMISTIQEEDIHSIAIPPLGCGNGGLNWSEVKEIIEGKLKNISNEVEIYVYEPSANYKKAVCEEPNLSASALVLIDIKLNLHKFNKTRLQKTAYFVNLFSQKHYFNFEANKFGPYDHAIEVISRKIKEFQIYYGTSNTMQARTILYNRIVSESVNNVLESLSPYVKKACDFVNSISTDHELECLATICFIVERANIISEPEIVNQFKQWSEDKANRFKEQEILEGIWKLNDSQILSKTLVGYIINDIK